MIIFLLIIYFFLIFYSYIKYFLYSYHVCIKDLREFVLYGLDII